MAPYLSPTSQTWTEINFLPTPTPGLEESGVNACAGGFQVWHQRQVGWWEGGVCWSSLFHLPYCYLHQGRNLCFYLLMSCTP